MFQEIVSPSGKGCKCIKGAERGVGFYGKVCFTVPDCDVYVTMRDERHRDKEIGNGAWTQFLRKLESSTPCIHNWMM